MKKHKKLTIALLVVVALAAGLFLIHKNDGKALTPEETHSPKDKAASDVFVRTSPLEMKSFNERLIIQGNLEAKNAVVVPSRVAGTIEKIFVDEGDCVEACKTKLFQIDSLKLRKTVESARNDLEGAKASLRVNTAGLEQVDADLAKDLKDYQRYKRLHEGNTVSADAYETRMSEYRKTLAERKHAVALVDLAREHVRQAEAALEIAEKNFQDALVLAPISGIVSKRHQEPGEMGSPGQPVVRIEDPTLIEVVALLPAQYYPRITSSKTPMKVTVYGLDLGEVPITYKSPTIDPELRTFEIKALLENKDGRIAPGAMADLEVSLERHDGLGVPEEAVLKRGDQSVIFTVIDGQAREIQVKTGLENQGWIEVQAETLKEGLPVVTMGQNRLEDGVPVRISGEDA